MPDITPGLTGDVTVFVLAALAIAVAGSRLSYVADRLADATGIGEALVGAVLLGGVTSASGLAASLTAAAEGHPELAVSNGLGGIAAQTMILAIADITYRRANLEHAAASQPNLLQGALLIGLLSCILVTPFAPETTFASIHIASPIILIAYVVGTWMVFRAQEDPQWRPTRTPLTRTDTPDVAAAELANIPLLAVSALVMGAIVAAGGWAIAHAGTGIAEETALSQTFVGGLFTGATTSLPELVTVIAAVRLGALTMAVGVIIGGNVFDTIFVPLSDVAFRGGSVYHTIPDDTIFLAGMTVIMSSVLLFGLLYRQRMGIGRIGFESAAIIVLYALTLTTIGLS